MMEKADRWELQLHGHEVTQCRIDYAVTLVLEDATGTFYVTIEQPFFLKPSSELDEVLVTPEGSPAALGPALLALRKSVDRVVAHKDGRLELDFVGGVKLRAPMSEDYEAWNLVGPAGLRIVSMPGGELAIWNPETGRDATA